MLIGAGLLRRPDIFSARPSRLHSYPVSPAQPAASVRGSLERRKAAAAEAKQFLVSPPPKFRLDRVPIDVFKTNCSENDAVRYFELDHLQRPDASGRRSKVSYVPSESERIDLK
jgi:hypothetical protein